MRNEMKRSWLVLHTSDATTVAGRIWNENSGTNFAKFDSSSKLKYGWVVRADVIDVGIIMVPVVGEVTSEKVDPINLIAKAIEARYKVRVIGRFDVTQHIPDPSCGNNYPPENDEPGPAPLPLNAWG